MPIFTSNWRMMPSFSLISLLLLTTLLPKGFWVSGSPACASCGLPAMEKDAEQRLLIEFAKQQLLDKLHLKEKPNITQTVPKVALLTALRKLHSGRFRHDGTLELENSLPHKDQGYEIVSFAEISKFCFHFSYSKAALAWLLNTVQVLVFLLKLLRKSVCISLVSFHLWFIFLLLLFTYSCTHEKGWKWKFFSMFTFRPKEVRLFRCKILIYLNS